MAARLRPNPFAVPSATAVRFALLIFAASAAVFVHGESWFLTNAETARLADRSMDACIRTAIDDAARHTGARFDLWAPRFFGTSCDAGPADGLGSGAVALVLFWCAVLLVYWWMPAWRRRRRRLRPVEDLRVPDVAEYLADLRAAAGVSRHVRFVVDRLDPGVSGVAFGRVGRRYVMLKRGTLALYEQDRVTFRSIVLHELAHVRNRDVDMAYLTLAVWLVFLIGLVPLEIARSWTLLLEAAPLNAFAASSLWQLVILAVMVPLTGSAVLRSRELHADARAALWDQGSDGLARLFDQQRRPKTTWFARALHVHPLPAERKTALTDTRSLLAVGFWEPLAMGLAAMIGYDMALAPLGIDQVTAAIVFLATLLATGVGLGLWRAAVTTYVSGKGPDIDRIGLGFGLGLALGALVSPNYVVLADTLHRSMLGFVAPWLVLLALGGCLFVRWLAAVTHAWITIAATGPRRVTIAASLLAATIVLAASLAFFLPKYAFAAVAHAIGLPHVAPPLVFFYVTFAESAFMHMPFVYLLLLALTLYPFLGLLLARSPASPSRTGWLSLDGQLPDDQDRARIGAPASGIKTGLVTALCALSALFLFLLLGGVFARNVVLAMLKGHAIAVLVLVTHVLGAAIAAARAAQWRTLHGMIAGATVGIITVPGQLAITHLVPCILSPFRNTKCSLQVIPAELDGVMYLLTWGIEVASATAVVVAGALWLTRGLRQRPTPQTDE